MSSTRPSRDPSSEGDPTAGGSNGSKGPMTNGSTDAIFTPELLYKMNKKIAQLTKVVYGLNTRGEELEHQLGLSKETEEKTRALNNDLQHRVNTFKTKIEAEMGKLRDLETQANQAKIWKLECESLQRRLDAMESNKIGGDTSYLAIAKAREEIDQCKRRENGLQFELDQARHAISNLKAHHDFIMRERTSQQAMENEKILLEWQTRCAELEARYKSQIRRLTDDKDVMASECELLKSRKSRSSSANEEGILRDQVMALQMQYETDRREWEMQFVRLKEEKDETKLKYNRIKDELEEQGIKHTEERRELLRKLQMKTEDSKNEDSLEARIRNRTATFEERIRELTKKNENLQRKLNDKEEEFELTLKTKVVEWKSEWELAEEELHKEIKKLKNENAKIKSEAKGETFATNDSKLSNRIKELEKELAYKNGELNAKAKDSEARQTSLENENARLRHEKLEWQKILETEKETTKEKLKTHETCEKSKEDFLHRIHTLKDTEKMLREANRIVEADNETLKREKDELINKIKVKENEWQRKLENDVKNAEIRSAKKVERIWLDKLKQSEDSSSDDLEKIQEANRRREEALKRELNIAKQVEEETRKTNEEIKRKLNDLRENEAITIKALKDSEAEVQNLKKNETIFSKKRKELIAQEERYQRQVDDLSKKLAEKQQEAKDLSETLKEAKKATMKKDSSEQQRYEIQIEQLKTKIREEETKTESVKVELQYARNEMEFSKTKIGRLEEDLTKANELAESLRERNANRSRDSTRLKELEDQVKSLEDKLRKNECSRQDLEKSLAGIETERDEEMKIVQDALDEAAEERQELITSFKKELELLNTTNTAREQQMLEDFEWKLHEMEKEYKSKLEDNNRQAENTFQRGKRSTHDEEFNQKMEKQRNEINAEWEDKLRKECSRLKAELDGLHSEEKHLAVESMKVQKEQEIQRLKKSWEQRHEEMATQVSSLKDTLADKEAYFRRELDNQRTMTDRDLWDLRMKLQRLNESSYDQKQQLEEKYREDMERLRVDYDDRLRELESRLAVCDAQKGVDLIGQMEKEHKTQMQHVGEQHRLSMERLREELEAEKFQAVEDTRLIITNHHVDIENNLKEQLAQAQTNESQIRDELEAIRFSLQRREESLRNLEEELERYKDLKNDSSYSSTTSSYPPVASSNSSGFGSSQFSLASSNESHSARNSQDRFTYNDSAGLPECPDDSQRNSGLLGKVFGGGWFTPTRSYSRRGSTPLSNKKNYS